MKQLDQNLLDILLKYGEKPETALWDCHGTWVAYHKAIERIAARAGVTFDMPQIIEANTAAKTATIAVRGTMGDRAEWSFGEASPSNNKNAYPFAMAEKRAKDRVVIKLVGLSGIYSEEEADDFKPERDDKPLNLPAKREVGWSKDGTTRTAHSLRKEKVWDEFQAELLECETPGSVTKLALAWSKKVEDDKWPDSWKDLLRDEMQKRMTHLKNQPAPDDDTFPGDIPTNGNAYVDNYRAG